MIARIIEFSARNRLLVLLGVLAATGASIWSIRKVKLDAVLDLSGTCR